MATAVKKAAKNIQDLKLPVFDDEMDQSYYRATVGDVKICGQIQFDTYSTMIDVRLMNSQGLGEMNDCDDEGGYTHILGISVSKEFIDDQYPADEIAKQFAKAGITSFTITEDRRMIAAIDRTKFARFNGEWSVTINSNDEVEFGCGDVTLSLKEIEDFIRIRRAIEKLSKNTSYDDTCRSIQDNIDVEYVDLDEAEELVEKAKTVIETRKQLNSQKKKKTRK